MSEIYQWVTNLLVLVVLMALSDLLVPSTSWRPFIRLVLGGLLLILLIEPLVLLFQKGDTISSQPFSQLEQSVSLELQQGKLIIDDMNNKHESYIWNEVGDKLARQAEPVMLEKFDLAITEVTVLPLDSTLDKFIGEVEVKLKGVVSLTYEEEQQVVKVLATEWGISTSSIKINSIEE